MRGLKRTLFNSWTAVLLGLGPLFFGLFAFGVGALSVRDAEDLNGRLEGLFFVASGIALLVGAVAIAKGGGPGWKGTAIMTSGVVGIALSLYLAITQVTVWTRILLVLVWLVALVASFVLLVLPSVTRRIGTAGGSPSSLDDIARADDHSSTRNWVARLSSLGISAGLAFNLFQASYTQAHASSIAKSYSLTIQGSLLDDGVSLYDNSLHLYTAVIAVKNPSSTEIQVARSAYAIVGYRASSVPDSNFEERILASNIDADAVSRYVTYGDGQLLELGPALSQFFILEPSQEVDRRLAFALPAATASQVSNLSLQISMVTTGPHLQVTGEWSSSGESRDCLQSGICIFGSEWQIRPQNTIWALTKGQQILGLVERVAYSGGGQALFLTACIQQADELAFARNGVCEGTTASAGMEDFYGIGITSATVDLSIVQTPTRPG